MARFLGYKNRRPYLWWVDLDERSVTAAAELDWIPQAIDAVVPFADGVALRMGLHWGALPRDLSGQLVPLDTHRADVADARLTTLDVVHDGDRSIGQILWPDGHVDRVSHPAVKCWDGFASIGPDGKTVALTGSTIPPKTYDLTDLTPHPYVAETATVLVILDLVSRELRVFDGRFDNFGVSTWSAAGDLIVVAAPFEPRRLFAADVAGLQLRPIEFKVNVPTLLVDGALVDTA